MGLVVILSAGASRAPKTLRALGAAMCMQGLAATFMGPDHARGIMEWETMQGTPLLRVGAAVPLAAGCFLTFAVTGQRPTSEWVERGQRLPQWPFSAHRRQPDAQEGWSARHTQTDLDTRPLRLSIACDVRVTTSKGLSLDTGSH